MEPAAIVAAVMRDVNYQQCMSHIPCRDLNTWLLYHQLDVRFGNIASHIWLGLMTFGLSEHKTGGCDTTVSCTRRTAA